jgi:hypothetical protein
MLDDDVAHDLALFAGLVWEDRDRAALGPLIDATLVWADEEQLDAIAAPIAEALWADGLREDIERAITERPERDAALADLALGPAGSRLARAYVKQGAVEFAHDAMVSGTCLCCAEDGLDAAPPERREQIAVHAAVAVVSGVHPEFGAAEPSEEELTAARERVEKVATLATASLPKLSAALRDVDIDAVWRAARAGRN